MTPPDAGTTLRLVEMVAAAAVIQGTLELLVTRRALADDGTWRWATLAPELRWLAPLLAYRPFLALLVARLALAALLLAGVRPGVAPALWITSLLVNIRFRGSSNGGSDMMQMVVLTALVVAHAAGPLGDWLGIPSGVLVSAALLYVATQAMMSYFIAGVVKIINAPWRSGAALASFVATPHFGTPAALRRLLSGRTALLAASWSVMLFECLFPVAFLDPRLALVMVSIAGLFHLGNVAAFGLNRFLLTWAATWPAVVHASSLMP